MKANQSTKLSQENVRELHADDMFRKRLRSCIFLGADHDGKSGINRDEPNNDGSRSTRFPSTENTSRAQISTTSEQR